MIYIKNINDSKAVPLDIPRGYYVLAQMTTMACYHVAVRIQDGDTKEVYFEDSRQSTDPLPPISKYFCCHSEHPELLITIPQSRQIDLRMDSMDIRNSKNELTIRTITAVGEDADDADYNDFLISLFIMKSNA